MDKAGKYNYINYNMYWNTIYYINYTFSFPSLINLIKALDCTLDNNKQHIFEKLANLSCAFIIIFCLDKVNLENYY